MKRRAVLHGVEVRLRGKGAGPRPGPLGCDIKHLRAKQALRVDGPRQRRHSGLLSPSQKPPVCEDEAE